MLLATLVYESGKPSRFARLHHRFSVFGRLSWCEGPNRYHSRGM